MTTDMAPSISQQPTFTCFSKLPPELRELVWDFALPEPQRLWMSDVGIFTVENGDLCNEHREKAYTIMRSLYFACKESHAIVKANWLGSSNALFENQKPAWKQKWFDARREILWCFNVKEFVRAVSGLRTTDKVKYLAIRIKLQHGATLDIAAIRSKDLARTYSLIQCFPDLRYLLFALYSWDYNSEEVHQFNHSFRKNYRTFGKSASLYLPHKSSMLDRIGIGAVGFGFSDLWKLSRSDWIGARYLQLSDVDMSDWSIEE